MKWFNFLHTPKTHGQQTPRPFFGAHLVDTSSGAIGDMSKPICDEADATITFHESEPRGFLLACCACLARSEVRQ